MTEERINEVVKWTDYREKTKNRTMKESELQDISNIVFEENTLVNKFMKR